MKITFEGNTIGEILDQMNDMLTATSKNLLQTVSETPKATALPTATVDAVRQGPGPAPKASVQTANVPVDKPVDKPLDKPPQKARTEKQKANDERLREAALAKVAAKKAAAPETTSTVGTPFEEPQGPQVDPVEVVKIRQKTIEDLQSAYANGHQKEVFELLSRFGNGAKSFRELPPEAFMPISDAISKGALT